MPDTPPNKYAAIILNQDFSYDTNPLKLVTGAKSLHGTETRASLTLNSHNPNGIAELTSIISRGFYSDPGFNVTNAHEILLLGKKNERWTADLEGRYDYDTTRTTEITSFGITAPNVRNKKYAISPVITFRLSPTNTLGLRGTYLNSTYDNNGFIDYKTTEVKPSLKHKFDKRNTGTINFDMQRYETLQGVKTTTNSYGPTLGWIWEYDDQLTARFSAGQQKSTQERANSSIETSSYNYVYDGNFTYRDEQSRTVLDISRAQRPTGNGISYLLTDINVKENYLIHDRLAARGSLGYRFATYITNPGTNLDTEYSGSGGLAYRIYKQMDLTANYAYTQQKLTGGNGQLRAHSILLGITFHPTEEEL